MLLSHRKSSQSATRVLNINFDSGGIARFLYVTSKIEDFWRFSEWRVAPRAETPL